MSPARSRAATLLHRNAAARRDRRRGSPSSKETSRGPFMPMPTSTAGVLPPHVRRLRQTAAIRRAPARPWRPAPSSARRRWRRRSAPASSRLRLGRALRHGRVGAGDPQREGKADDARGSWQSTSTPRSRSSCERLGGLCGPPSARARTSRRAQASARMTSTRSAERDQTTAHRSPLAALRSRDSALLGDRAPSQGRNP